MKKEFNNDRQIMGSLFAIIIVLFSIGNSYIGARENINKAEQQLAYSSVSAIRIAQEDGPGYRDNLPIPYQFLFTVSSFVSSEMIRTPGIVISKTFHLSVLISNGVLSLPCIHAP